MQASSHWANKPWPMSTLVWRMLGYSGLIKFPHLPTFWSQKNVENQRSHNFVWERVSQKKKSHLIFPHRSIFWPLVVQLSLLNQAMLVWYFCGLPCCCTKENTVRGLISDWNASVEVTQKKVDAHNAEIIKALEEGKNSGHAAAAGLHAFVVGKPSKSWRRHFLRKHGWSMFSKGADSTSWLPYSHPDMEASRAHMRELLQRIHPAMCLNYGQVWRTAFTFGGRLLWKPRKMVGERGKACKLPQRQDKKLHFIEGSRRSITAIWLY